MALVLKSERQIQTEMLSVLIFELGLNDVNPGSVIDVITQAAAQQDFAQYFQIAQLSRLADIDALTGDDLDTKAFEYGIERLEAVEASGTINILRPAGFEKVSTTFFAGFPAPVAGNTQIFVNDASNVLIGSSGTLIIGRGTNNEEEVTYSVAPVNNTNYWTFTLDAPLVNNHSTAETIILKQGSDESIPAGTTVIVPATGTNPEIQFTTVNDETLLAGELQVTGVEVIASEPGTDGNIASGSISGTSAFPTPPFIGARATNPAKFTTGRDLETDDELRDRIKDTVQSLSRGVKQAILNAIVGLVDPGSAKRVVSASVVLPVDECGPVLVYIDDGTGFEPTFLAQGFETIRASSTGGEQRLQLDQFPIVKAQVENNVVETYDMSSGPLTLEYTVGTLSETITFNPADFRFPDSGTAEEIAAAINDKATLIEARTSQSGSYVTITARADENESIQVTGGTANAILGFPTDKKNTINLYVDDVRLSKDGETAILDSGNQAPYNLLAVGAYPHELNIIVDGKSANPQVATIALADVDDPAAVTVDEIVAVLNRDLAGITAFGVNSNTRVRIESNTKLSASSKLEVTGGSANDGTNGLDFDTTEKVGVDGDYTFNRELGIVQLAEALGANQTVTIGSLFTRGKLRASSPELYAPADTETLVISVDGGPDQTITFDATFVAGQTAAATAAFINEQLDGATAIVRTIGGLNYLEINTNTFGTNGSIEITSASTANSAFGFTLDTSVSSSDPNKAFQVSGNSGPFDLFEGATLVVVLDNDIVNKTFSVLFNVAGTVTTGTSTTVFADTSLPDTFEEADQIVDYYAAFLTGANTTSETIDTVTDIGGGLARYEFSSVPANFADYVVGDLANISGLDNSGNNINGVIAAKGAQSIDVLNPDVVNATTQSGTGVLSQKRTVTAYNQLTGEVTVGSGFTNTPSPGDSLVIIPNTVSNVVEFMNNTKISSLSLEAAIEGVEDNSKVQISSLENGSDGYVQITGGDANEVFDFNTELLRGIAGYEYWTGLLELTHRTIYGDDSDLVSFPGVGAAGVVFRVLAPTTKEITIQLDVTLREGVSISSLENEIRSAVTAYVNNLGVGEDVVIEEIRAAVIDISGITDVDLTEPTANIAIADNELARVADADILIG